MPGSSPSTQHTAQSSRKVLNSKSQRPLPRPDPPAALADLNFGPFELRAHITSLHRAMFSRFISHSRSFTWIMDLTRTAYGTWSGGRYMHFGEPLSEERFLKVIQYAYRIGIRSFLTADVYGDGAADEILGRALAGLPRESYCLVGAVGHDFYSGKRDGSKGYPRFTNPQLRSPNQYLDYLRMATETSLARCGADRFDGLLLHNPDSIGYTSDAVWKAMDKLREAKLADRLGVAPGPANGF